MADTIGSLAYKLKLDNSEFKAGMAATRAEFSAAKAITRESATGLDSYRQAAQNLDTLLAKGLVNIAQHSAAKEKLTQSYLEQEAQVRRLTAAELAHLKTLRDASAATKTTAQDEADRAKMMERGRAITEATRSAQDKLNRELVEARKLYRAGAIDASTYAKHVAELKKNAAGPGMFAGAGAVMKGTLGAMGAAAGIGSLISTGKEAIMLNASLEKSEAAMEAFTGSASRASAMMADFRKLSSAAGISVTNLADSTATMMGFGVSADVASGKLRQFAEISRGDSERFKSLALAFGQVAAAGKLMGQENLQLINAGFAPLAEISRTTGIEMSKLKKMMEDGQISTQMVSDAFASATSEGGRFFGMLEKNAETSSGSLSRLSAEWDKFLSTVGKVPPTKGVAGFLSDTLGNFSAGMSRYGSAEDKAAASGELMEAAKKRPSALSNELNAATARGAELDEKIKQTQFYKDSQAMDKQRAEAKAAEEARKKRIQDGVDSLTAAQQTAKMEFIQKNDPQALKQFNRISDLLEGPKKKQAIEEFSATGNINKILPLLDKELQIELEKLNVLEKQNEERLKGASKRGMVDSLAKDIKSTVLDPLTKNTGIGSLLGNMKFPDIKIPNIPEMLQDAQRSMVQHLPDLQRHLESKRDQQVAAHSPAASIAQGSQEAYKLMVANQTRGDISKDPQIKKLDQQISEIKKSTAETRKVVEAVNRVAEKLDFEMVG